MVNVEQLPSYVTTGIVLPLLIAFVSICCFSFFYMRRYRKKYENDRISFLVSVFALILVFILTALAPVDTYIVSEMKYSNGSFKDWALDLTLRAPIEKSVMIVYIVLYCLICFTLFCVLPFTYFLYDSRNDEDESSGGSICSALIGTLLVLIVPAAIVIISFFTVNVKREQSKISDLNGLFSDGGFKVISSLLSVLGGLGMLNLIIYTGFGMATFPIDLIRGLKDTKKEYDENSRRQMSNTAAINSLRSKRAYLGRLSEEDEMLLRRLETRERDDQLKETIMRNHLSSWTYKLKYIIRPAEIVFGVVFMLISMLIIVSLIINNIDSLMHSTWQRSYLLEKKSIFNPVDHLLTAANRVYPLDFALYLAISWYLIFCTLSGVRNLGIGLFLYKLGKFRPGQTTPQGLLLASSVLMMSMMAINLLMFNITPEYSSFGNQLYMPENATSLAQCIVGSPETDCTETRSSYLIETYFYHGLPYVGIGLFFSTWLVALFFVLAMIYSICRSAKKRTFNETDGQDFEEDSHQASGSFRSTFNSQSRPF